MSLRQRRYLSEVALLRLPYNADDLQNALEDKGWRYNRTESRKKTKRHRHIVLRKRFGGIPIEVDVEDFMWSSSLFVGLVLGSAAMDVDRSARDKLAKIWYQRVDYTPTLDAMVRDIEKTAKEVADAVRKLPKEKKVKKEFEWRGETGPRAKKRWTDEVEKVIMRIVSGYRGERGKWGPSTAAILDDVLDNHGLEPDHMVTKEAKAAVRAILNRLERQNKIEGWTEGRRGKKRWLPR